jgi:hypothetical protein
VRVSGTFTLVAGVDIVPRPIDGTVTFSQRNETGTVHVVVGNTGKFTALLYAGEWFATGRSPKFIINNHEAECGPSKSFKIDANTHTTTSVQVQCIGK